MDKPLVGVIVFFSIYFAGFLITLFILYILDLRNGKEPAAGNAGLAFIWPLVMTYFIGLGFVLAVHKSITKLALLFVGKRYEAKKTEKALKELGDGSGDEYDFDFDDPGPIGTS